MTSHLRHAVLQLANQEHHTTKERINLIKVGCQRFAGEFAELSASPRCLQNVSASVENATQQSFLRISPKNVLPNEEHA
ncbi:unnamed protein product [Nesidiocoris tenuis]|uniref:Uncharacterized protein n=1 Tax=Nesidiocoris tenuis TaxID=355587 RepID=A0A6H5GB96_9HEMI|nr:unnamed protein product [Nesidiocoris tenuis]